MISLKQLLSENASNPMVPVQGIVAEFMSGVVQLSLLSLDNNSIRNDLGFNTTHLLAFDTDRKFFKNSQVVPLDVLVKWINYMKVYKNTQNPYNRPYPNIIDDLKRELASFFKKPTEDEPSSDKLVRLTTAPINYGKYVVYVSDGERIFPRNRKWKAVLDDFFAGQDIQRERDYYGNLSYPVFKYFSKSKNSIDGTLYEVRPELFEPLANFFKKFYPDYTVQLPPTKVAAATPSTPSRKLELTFVSDSSSFSFWTAENSQLFSRTVKELGIYEQGILFPMKIEETWVYRIWHGQEQLVIDKLNGDGKYDTSKLVKYVSEIKKPEVVASTDARFTFSIVGTDISVKPRFRKSEDLRGHQLLAELIKFGFPVWMEDRTYDTTTYSHIIETKNLNDLFTFYRTLEKQNLKADAKNFSDILNELKKQNVFKNSHIDGVLSEYKNDVSEFNRDVNDSTNINLYAKQVTGVRHLFSRKASLLGDETGVGKTAQLITAANLRMRFNNGKCLIITLKSTQPQWAQEIIKFVGASKNDISFDGTAPKKWTILYYENFQAGKQLKTVVETTQKTDYTVAIFDEIHKIKHGSAKRSNNIFVSTNKIPYKWGASATMAANKPADIKNQLKMLGHRMGDVSDGWFKREFSGMVPEGYNGAYVDGPRENQIAAAIQFRKWLANAGLYIRRSKKEIRAEMPSLKRDTIQIELTPSELNDFKSQVKGKLATYKDSSLALSKLIAARESVAAQKVPYTVKRAVEIIKNGEKIVIFTAFKQSGKQLVESLTTELRRLNPKYKVGSYTSDSKDRAAEKKNFINDPFVKILVMSIKVGGTGVDFPNGVNHMLINDFDWTPEQAEQSEGRIFRINSMDNKHVEYIIAANTIDTEVYDIVSKKREISDILQSDLTKAYENPDDVAIAKSIYDNTIKMQQLDKKLSTAAHKVS